MTVAKRPLPLGVWVIIGFAFYLALMPSRMFLLNEAEVQLEPAALLVVSSVLFVLAVILPGAIYALLGAGGRRRFTWFWLTLFAIVFIYDNVLFPLLPELDGVALAVSTPYLYFIDALAVVLLLWALWSGKPVSRRAGTAALLFFVALPVLGLLSSLLSERPDTKVVNSAEVDFSLSPELNVIHILFDALQATEFPLALEKLPDKDAFSGFTWFRNTVGASYKTSYSLPAIFSGKIYTDFDQFQEYYSGDARTLMDVVSANDFDIYADRWMHSRTPPGMTRFQASRTGQESPLLSEGLGQILDISLMRIAPFSLKNTVLNGYEFRIAGLARQGAPVGNEAQRRGLLNLTGSLYVDVDSPAPRYYFMHLLYPHAPYTHNEDCSYAGKVLESSRKQAKLERYCAVRDFAGLLDRLRDLGVYDQTLIVFQSDTGESRALKPRTLRDSDLPSRVKNGSPFALLAVKPVGANAPMQVSNEPASIQDVPNTILGQLGLDGGFEGVDLFNAPDLGGRKRIYWAAEQGTFGVVGNMYQAASWRRLADNEKATAADIKAGDRYGFSLVDPSGIGLLQQGFHRPLQEGINARFPESTLRLPLSAQAAGNISELVLDVQLTFPPGRPVTYRLNNGPLQPVELVPSNPLDPRDFTFSVKLDELAGASELILAIQSEKPGDPDLGAKPENLKASFAFRLRTITVN